MIIDQYWLQFDQVGAPESIVIAVTIVILNILSVVGNGIVVYFQLRYIISSSRIYFIALALSDFIAPLLTYWMVIHSTLNGKWQFGDYGCNMYGFCQGVCSLMSIVFIAVIAADRCITVCKHWQGSCCVRLYKLKKYPKTVASCVCSYCILICFPPLAGWGRYTLVGSLTSCCFDFIKTDLITRSFFIYLFVLGFALPLLVITTCYSSIIYVLYVQMYEHSDRIIMSGESRHTSDPSSRSSQRSILKNSHRHAARYKRVRFSASLHHQMRVEARRLGRINKEKNVLMMMLFVIAAFLGAWSPYAVLSLIGQFSEQRHLYVNPTSITLANIIAKSSTVYNVFIYAFMNKKFRDLLVSKLWNPMKVCLSFYCKAV